jgi:hypothetical protein
MGGVARNPERQPSPRFAGGRLPVPPRQNTPWSPPPASLPTNYVSATAILFEAGMADPRGCEYRAIEVGTGSAWNGDGGVVKTHGWVLPGGGTQSFAVCWNGLVYSTVTVGEKADWRADARAAIQHAKAQWGRALPEAYTVAFDTCLPLEGCLLLRLGEPVLAGELWVALQQANERRFESQPATASSTNAAPAAPFKLAAADPYLDWASDWAWDLFDRAVCAHMRGDDGLALASARLLTAARPTLESEAHRRGFPRPRSSSATWNEPYQDYLTFLAPLPDLLADQERRAGEGVPGGPRTDVSGLTNQPARIAALIGELDQVAVRQWGQPGGLGPWESDPVVAGLLKEGPAAIEPLLECLESPCASRLTRSVSFGRDFSRGRWLHSISQPVVDILVKLMGASYATVGIERGIQAPSNAVLAARLRAYWGDYGKLPPAERWFHKLADDNAGSAAWADALGNIVHTVEPTEGNTNKAWLVGDPLRAKSGPSVTDLLVRRAKTLADSAQAYNSFAVGEAVAFLLNAEKWEAPPLLPIAADLQEKVMAGYDGTDNIGSTDPLKAGYIASLALLRARHGDTRGLDDFAAWIQQAKPGVLEDSVLDALEPFWGFPAHPALREAAQRMFGQTNSAWGNLDWLLAGHGFLRWDKPLATPILLIPEIRALVLSALTNHAVAGEATNRGGGNLEVKYADGGTVNYGARKDLDGLEVGAKVVFRRCDIIAEQLSTIPGFPPMSLVWSEPKRDEAVGAAIKLLSTSGDRLRAREKPAGWSRAFGPPLIELNN